MSTDQLAGDAVHHLVESEAILFASQLAVINHLEQQVAQFLAQLREIPLLYGVRYFVGFFQGVRDDGRVALLEIPGAAEFGIAQARHEVEQVVESVHGYLRVFSERSGHSALSGSEKATGSLRAPVACFHLASRRTVAPRLDDVGQLRNARQQASKSVQTGESRWSVAWSRCCLPCSNGYSPPER